MKDHIGIAEKLNRESILRSGGALLRSRPNCRIGIERESLRCTACGMLSEAAHPASLGGKDDNPYITTDWAESQIELITPPCESPAAAHRFLEMLTDIVLRELASRQELLWPLSTPCRLPDAGRIACARFEEAAENTRRRKLREKYPVEMLLLSGIHCNFSFTDEFLRRIADGADRKAVREAGYLKTARNLQRLLWFAVGLLGASPAGTAGISVRNSSAGYKSACSAQLDYTSVAAYCESVNRCLETGLIAAPSELYTPVRLRFSEKPSGRPVEINRLELRFIDLNPFEKCGISAADLELLRLLLFHCLLTGESELERFSEDFETVAENGFTPGQREKAAELLKQLGETARLLHVEIPGALEGAAGRLHCPEHSYAERIRKAGTLSPELLRRAETYRDDALAEAWRLPGFDELELSTQCMIREAVKGGIHFEVISREDNILRLRKGTRREYVVQATRTSLDTYVTPLLMNNKLVSKMLLREHGIHTPDGIELRPDDDLADRLRPFIGKRAVVKPVSTNYGIGISVFEHPATEEQLREAVRLAAGFDRHILVEEFCPGREFRFLVIAGKTFAVTFRRACHVVGDGVSTIHELIERANRHPWRAPGHHRPLVTIVEDEAMRQHLALQALDFGSVIPAGEDIPLRRISNISAGGEACDATELMPERFKRIAERAAAAFDAVICGVDIIIPEPLGPGSSYAVIEANFNPALLIHEFPFEGKSRPAARQVLIALGLLDD